MSVVMESVMGNVDIVLLIICEYCVGLCRIYKYVNT